MSAICSCLERGGIRRVRALTEDACAQEIYTHSSRSASSLSGSQLAVQPILPTCRVQLGLAAGHQLLGRCMNPVIVSNLIPSTRLEIQGLLPPAYAASGFLLCYVTQDCSLWQGAYETAAGCLRLYGLHLLHLYHHFLCSISELWRNVESAERSDYLHRADL